MKDPSPLVVWKAICLVIVAATIAMLIVDPMGAVVQRSDGVLAKRLSHIRFANDETGIIFFGNSLLNRGLPVRKETLVEELNDEFRKNGHSGKYIPVKMTTGGVNAWRLQGLSDKLIEARPSIIVVQGEMFISRRAKGGLNPRLAKRIGTWSGLLNLQLFGSIQNAGDTKVHGSLFPGIEKSRIDTARLRQRNEDETLAMAKDFWANQVVSKDTPEFIISLNFVRRAAENGIRVMVVELPVSETAAKFATRDYLENRTRVIGKLTNSDIIHLVYPRILPDNCFRDYRHLSKRGRNEFLRWFIPAFTQAVLKDEVIQQNQNH